MMAHWALLAILAWHLVTISTEEDGVDFERQWHGYKKAFGKSYSSTDEEEFRQQVYQQNLKAIDDWNQLYHQGRVSYKVGLNQLADQTYEERRALKVNLMPSPKTLKTKVLDLSTIPTATQFQWSQYFTLDPTNCVSPVRNQRNCASGYAIAALTLLEFFGCRKSGTFQSYSLDQALDCSTYSQGCKGGYCEEVFQYFTENSIMPMASYRPQNNRATKCMYDPSAGIGTLDPTAVFQIGSPGYQTSPNETIPFIISALNALGPFAGRFDSGGPKSLFDFYKSGIYDDPNCANVATNGNNATDHTLVLIGVGVTDSGEPVWIAQNSMGTNWGDNGRVYLPLMQNTCNLEALMYAINPFVVL